MHKNRPYVFVCTMMSSAPHVLAIEARHARSRVINGEVFLPPADMLSVPAVDVANIARSPHPWHVMWVDAINDYIDMYRIVVRVHGSVVGGDTDDYTLVAVMTRSSLPLDRAVTFPTMYHIVYVDPDTGGLTIVAIDSPHGYVRLTLPDGGIDAIGVYSGACGRQYLYSDVGPWFYVFTRNLAEAQGVMHANEFGVSTARLRAHTQVSAIADTAPLKRVRWCRTEQIALSGNMRNTAFPIGDDGADTESRAPVMHDLVVLEGDLNLRTFSRGSYGHELQYRDLHMREFDRTCRYVITCDRNARVLPLPHTPADGVVPSCDVNTRCIAMMPVAAFTALEPWMVRAPALLDDIAVVLQFGADGAVVMVRASSFPFETDEIAKDTTAGMCGHVRAPFVPFNSMFVCVYTNSHVYYVEIATGTRGHVQLAHLCNCNDPPYINGVYFKYRAVDGNVYSMSLRTGVTDPAEVGIPLEYRGARYPDERDNHRIWPRFGHFEVSRTVTHV